MAHGISVFQSPTTATLSTVLERAIIRRRLRQHGGYAYKLELLSNFTKQFSFDQEDVQQSNLDLNQTLNDLIDQNIPLQFVLVRENSKYSI